MLGGLAIFFVALLHEDVALVTAGFFIAERGMPFGVALALVYGGVLTNNLSVYGIGVLAHRLPVAHRWLIGHRVERVGQLLRARAVPAVLFCRLAPGTLFLTFIGCGWFGVPFSRFAPAAAVAAAVYVSVMLSLVTAFGKVVLQRLSEGAWIVFAAVVVVAFVVLALRRFRKIR